jgi:hypothetical protein
VQEIADLSPGPGFRLLPGSLIPLSFSIIISIGLIEKTDEESRYTSKYGKVSMVQSSGRGRI